MVAEAFGRRSTGPSDAPGTGSWRHVGLDALVLLGLLLLAIAPFRDAVGRRDSIPFGMDLTQHYSRESVNRLALETTWLPLWNPYEFSGFPAQADIQTGAFYPPSLLLRLFSVPSFLTWTDIFHVWMFGVGGYVLCRTFGVRRAAAAIGATGLMLGGITLPRVYAGHFDVLRTVAWVPLALATAFASIDQSASRDRSSSHDQSSTGNRPSTWPSAAAVVVLSLELLASFLQLVCYTFAAIALYAAFSAIWPPRTAAKTGYRSWSRARAIGIKFLGLVILVLGVTAFQWLPTARLVAAAGRTHGMNYTAASESSIAVGDIWHTMFSAAPSDPIPAQLWETSAYIGWLLAALAPLALLAGKQRRTVVYCVFIGGTAIVLETGGALYRLHYAFLPMFRIPGRLMCFWSISLAILGAIALDWLAGASTIRRTLVLLVAGLVVATDLSSYARHFVRVEALTDRFATSVPFTPTRFGRVLSLCEDRIQTSELTALGLASVDGYNSYFLDDYAHLAELARGEQPADQHLAFPRIGTTRGAPNLDILSALNATEIIACEPMTAPGLELLLERPRFFLYRNTRARGRVAVRCENDLGSEAPIARACNEGTQVEVTSADTPTGRLRFRVAAPGPRTLLLSEPYYPERRAWVDGVATPVERADVALSAIHIGAGAHVVELRFVPTSLYVGAGVSAGVLALCAVAALRRRTRSSLQA